MVFEGIEYPYEILRRKKITVGRIEVVQDTIKIDGKEHPYTFTRTRDGVCIFPVCDKGIVIIEQYRHSVNCWMTEVPAGSVDQGESEEQAARRELLEETGFVAGQLIDMGDYWENEGASASKCKLYFTHCTAQQLPNPEKTEFIRTRVVSKKEFARMVQNNTFHLLIGLVAWYRAKENNLL